MRSFKKTISLLSMFGLMAFFAVYINACSKKSSNNGAVNNGYGINNAYGNPNGIVGSGIGVSPDRAITLELSLSQVGPNLVNATGILTVLRPSYGCNLVPGQYFLTSRNTVRSSFGSFDGLQLVASQGLTLDVGAGWMYGSGTQFNGRIYSSRLFTYAQAVQDYPQPASCALALD